jgi:AAA+ ATPase superfamily predicted ATPase
MKNVVGQAVRGSDFWDRKSELAKIWQAIENGTHPLLVAPRRVGKTSIMYKILDDPKDNYAVVYVNTESSDSENEFCTDFLML